MIVLFSCQSGDPDPDPEPGIPLTIAAERARNIKNLRYDLAFTIPATATDPIDGRATIRFTAEDTSKPLVLDFAPGAEHLKSVTPSRYRAVNNHIVIAAEELKAGENTVEIEFQAGDASLNRNPDFMYALFVPARAHLAFPCFDQPDLKARYTLQLTIPPDWTAVSNGAETSRENVGNGIRIRYAETQPIPTYLFTFAAGKFQVETAARNGRTFNMFHRETDSKKVARNREAAFDLHASALEWLEKYTSIAYPFGKFDFVLIPSFQFGGMEHPGSIYYSASSILLDESATESQMLGRASVIAHETAHMWFGDLVTMQWFNDVWMKEVFANFMAAKIVNPQFPKVNHELRFLTAHYPAAYGVDRTDGTHPIRQELANLNEAGSLYGAIIYQKAPIVMRQLERILGSEKFQDGLRVYLKQFQFGNATWLDLVKVLDERTDLDLTAWSRAWVEEAGRPLIRTELEGERLAFAQSDPQQGRSLRWTQQMEVLVGTAGNVRIIPVELRGERTEVNGFATMPRPDFVLPTGGGLAYGGFTLDNRSRAFLLQHLPDLKDPVARGAAWVTLWEEVLDRRVPPMDFLNLAMSALPREDTEQVTQLVLNYVDSAFWRYLPTTSRNTLAPKLEQVLRSGLDRAATSSLKSTYFNAFRSIVTTSDGVAFLERVWRRQHKIPGLTLAEPDEANMALELAVRDVPSASAILQEQHQRFANPDRKARFEFVIPALSDNEATRNAWFAKLSDVNNRRREPWVLEGMRYLNHPLRAPHSEKYVRPALELLREIQRTGDIFFPRNWIDATLGGHNTREAAQVVRAFLDEQTDYPIRLRRIILQAADGLFRASEILSSSS
ncbi:MAG: ERAP1-like C-terminal domain-containing protein [Acidobacteria bacterium]|nr:ERAP1-like C-terminal domain-containing protein [Acidobacteriota bacterium]